MELKDTRFYEAAIDAIHKELKELPAGVLAKYGGFYYEITGRIHRGVTKDPQRVRRLARKAFLLKQLCHFESNLLLAQEQDRKFMKEEPIEIIRGLPLFLQELPIDYFFHPSISGWVNSDTSLGSVFADSLVYVTNSGIRVRSKSERMIADALDQNGIPYLYDAGLALGEEVRYPDFTIRRPFDGKVFLWEHFGLMDDREYEQKTIRKLALYARHGYFPFDNLICTYERDMLDASRIQKYIEVFRLTGSL